MTIIFVILWIIRHYHASNRQPAVWLTITNGYETLGAGAAASVDSSEGLIWVILCAKPPTVYTFACHASLELRLLWDLFVFISSYHTLYFIFKFHTWYFMIKIINDDLILNIPRDFEFSNKRIYEWTYLCEGIFKEVWSCFYSNIEN